MGGDADPAYRIARCLQTKYERFLFYVSGYCKSAGTLVAIRAHQLIVSDHGELGPLDVQMSKKDELWETQSGLTVMDTLTMLQDNAFRAFETFFLTLMRNSGGAVTLRTDNTNCHRNDHRPVRATLQPSGPAAHWRGRQGDIHRCSLRQASARRESKYQSGCTGVYNVGVPVPRFRDRPEGS